MPASLKLVQRPHLGIGWDGLGVPGREDWEPVVVCDRALSPSELEALARKEPALFRAFAELPHEGEALRDFAEQYGRLGVQLSDAERDWLAHCDLPHAEPFTHWVREKIALWRAVQALDSVRGRRRGLLGERVHGDVLLDPETSRKLARQRNRFKAMEMKQNALGPKVAELVNERLAAFLLHPVIAWDKARAGFSIDYRPQTLIGLLWLQFMRAATRVKEAAPCQHCGNMLELTTERRGRRVHRRDARYCDDLCRASFHQARKLRARQLAREGLKIRAIARQMEEPMEDVRRWIAPTPRRRSAVKKG